MTRKLITILGKAQKGGDYREANYLLDDQTYRISYFGLALDQHLQSDHLIILGTEGSMWDNLAQRLGIDADLALLDAVEQDNVTPAILAPLAQAAREKLGKPVTCDLIPYGRSEAEQINTISQILSYYHPGDCAILDVTHGLRHLPMLIQQIANLLPTLRGTSIEGIYYGALDLTRDGTTPVLRMDGLQHISAWQNALAAYDYSGNSASLVPILKEIGISDTTTHLLKQASFFEQTHNLEQYRHKIRDFLVAIRKMTDNPLLEFIRPTLEKRLKFDNQELDWQHHFHIAKQALENHDYVRAALYGYEAIWERILEHKNSYNDSYTVRKKIVEKYVASIKGKSEKEKEDRFKLNNSQNYIALYNKYENLRKLRNALAHGDDDVGNDKGIYNFIGNSNQRKDIDEYLNSEDKLRRELADCLDKLKTLTL